MRWRRRIAFQRTLERYQRGQREAGNTAHGSLGGGNQGEEVEHDHEDRYEEGKRMGMGSKAVQVVEVMLYVEEEAGHVGSTVEEEDKAKVMQSKDDA